MFYYCLYTTRQAKAYDIAELRRQIARRLGKSNDEWHNHDLESGSYIHRYPLIQYKYDEIPEALRVRIGFIIEDTTFLAAFF
jgi:hypothetical protein